MYAAMDFASVMVPSLIIRSTSARVNQADRMSCSASSRCGTPCVRFGRQEDPAPLAEHAWRDVEHAERGQPVGQESGLLTQLARGERRFVDVEPLVGAS